MAFVFRVPLGELLEIRGTQLLASGAMANHTMTVSHSKHQLFW